MEHNSLGDSGPSVSVFGLGTMTFGAEADEPTSHAILDTFVDGGGTFIDTANVYSAGASEQIIGRWLAKRQGAGEIFIATKARFPMGDGPDEQGASRRHLTAALDASLSRLGVDVIDLYQIHGWDPATPLAETLETLNDFVEAGKVRHIGLSNFTAGQLQRAISMARCEDLAPIVSLQPQYSLLGREIELEILPVCIDEGIGTLIWSPLAGGWLTGKYSPEERPTGDTRLGDDPSRGIEAYDLRNTDQTWRVLDKVQTIAAGHGRSMAQVALNWLRRRPGVSSVLLGARTPNQLLDNLAALEWSLDDDEMHALDAISAPGIPIYPHAFLETYAGVHTWADLRTRVAPPPIGR